MINGAHIIIYSRDAESDRAFFKDVLRFPSVDAGHGWLIFALPPSEVAYHPADENNDHKLYLMCDDLRATISELSRQQVACSEPQEVSWGLLTTISLPGGGELGLYQPKHARPSRS